MMEVIVIAGFLIIFVISEVLFRRKILSNEYARKLTHATSGLWTLFAPFLISFKAIVWIAILYAVILAILHNKRVLSSISISNRRTFGSITMPVGIATVAILFPSSDIFIPSIGVLTFADTAAGLLGRGKSKSLLGSFVFFLTTLCVLFAIPPIFNIQTVSILQAVVIALSLTVVERISPLGFDNFTIPVIASLMLHFLSI